MQDVFGSLQTNPFMVLRWGILLAGFGLVRLNLVGIAGTPISAVKLSCAGQKGMLSRSTAGLRLAKLAVLQSGVIAPQ